MKSTGIVRRVDDLGRVVIPKEIRRVLSIQEGDPLEIFVDSENQEVVLRKYDKVDYAMLWNELKRHSEFADKMNEIEDNYRRDYL